MGVPLEAGGVGIFCTQCFSDDRVVVAQGEKDARYMTRKLVEEYRD